MPESDAEVVIAGASFAGLAVARALRGRDVVLLDPHPVGAFPKSGCALPISTARAFGAYVNPVAEKALATLEMTLTVVGAACYPAGGSKVR